MTNPRDRGIREGHQSIPSAAGSARRAAPEGDVALDDLFARTFEREDPSSSSRLLRTKGESESARPPFSTERRGSSPDASMKGRGAGSRPERGGGTDALSMVPEQIAGLSSGKKAKHDDEPKRLRGILLSTFLIGLAIAGSAGVYMLRSHSSGQDGTIAAPTILADVNPYKVRPANPGGLQVANKDKLVYNRLASNPGTAGASIETLLPEPVVPTAPVDSDGRMPSILNPVEAAAPNRTDKIVKELRVSSPAAIKPLQKPTAPTAVHVARSPAVNTGQQSIPSAKVAKSQQNAHSEAVASSATLPETSVKAGENRTAKNQKLVTAVQVAGPYTIQLAALRDEASVRTLWKDLQKRYPAQLGALSMRIERADLGQKGIYYRLRATGLSTDKAARNVCHDLSKDKVACLFVGK